VLILLAQVAFKYNNINNTTTVLLSFPFVVIVISRYRKSKEEHTNTYEVNYEFIYLNFRPVCRVVLIFVYKNSNALLQLLKKTRMYNDGPI